MYALLDLSTGKQLFLINSILDEPTKLFEDKQSLEDCLKQGYVAVPFSSVGDEFVYGLRYPGFVWNRQIKNHLLEIVEVSDV